MILAFLFWVLAFCSYEETLVGPIVVGLVTFFLGGLPGFITLVLWGLLLD